MTTYNKATLKTFFETGDVPGGSNYADFIDSYVNIVDTALQTMAGPLSTTEVITPRVSAANANVTGVLSAATLSVDSITTPSITASAATITGIVSADRIVASAGNFVADVSAGGTIYASAMRSTNGVLA